MTEAPLDAIEIAAEAPDLRADFRVVFAGAVTVALLSFYFLPTSAAVASTVLGVLMIAGAEVDARAFLLPDTVTYGAAACGIVAAFCLAPAEPWLSAALAALRAIGAAFVLLALRAIHQRLRGVEGLGLGDIKLAAAIGAWLSLDRIPFCFALAASAALASVAFRASRSDIKTMRVPFGAYLCPALWLVFFVSALPA
jgi:leader peptidase (prepilin peptidase)/N-methyltransferase